MFDRRTPTFPNVIRTASLLIIISYYYYYYLIITTLRAFEPFRRFRRLVPSVPGRFVIHLSARINFFEFFFFVIHDVHVPRAPYTFGRAVGFCPTKIAGQRIRTGVPFNNSVRYERVINCACNIHVVVDNTTRDNFASKTNYNSPTRTYVFVSTDTHAEKRTFTIQRHVRPARHVIAATATHCAHKHKC